MSVVTTISEDGRFKVTRSDAGFYIRKKRTKEIYAEAWDLVDSKAEYLETTDKIETDDTRADEQSD